MTSYARPSSMMPVTGSQSYVRQRAVSSSAMGSPYSMRSNIAVADGPVSGNYYGVYLAEPGTRNGSSSNLSSTSSVRGSASSKASGSPLSTSNNKPSSSVAFPVTVLSTSSTRAEPVYIINTQPVLPQATSSRLHRVSVSAPVPQNSHASVTSSAACQPVPACQQSSPLPSAMKRQRRTTMTPSHSSSEELPASALRSLCKFSIGAIGECLKRSSNKPMFHRLRETDAVLRQMYTILFAMSSSADADMLPTSESTEITSLLQKVQALLYRSLSNRPYNSSRLAELEEYYQSLVNCTNRLDLTFKIKDLETKIHQLTFQHNVSQTTSIDIVKALQNTDLEHRPKRKSEVEQKRTELNAMHAERLSLREHINKAKAQVEALKKQRDGLLGIKSVRFQ
ncbi:hypothetical protein FRC20_010804 [Serendipita sp. 405]|nr:hypothetical protein FRC15_010148 [Serendipita sp. 397]KAG8795165.1 hypothetical protein FRC16_010199 [Serendipita sp. 398]KAG8863389.1 hypothetical protein FRC20_010804 [Serendipita sp. 405]